MVAEFSLICYKDMAGKSIGNANMPKIKQYHKYHNRLGDGNMMLNEPDIDEQQNWNVTHT